MDKRLNIWIALKVQQAAISSLNGSLNLLKSTLASIGRTMAVAGVFGFLAGVNALFNSIKTGFTELSAKFAELNMMAMRNAVVMSEGGSKTQETFRKISDFAREMSNTSMYSLEQVQEGLGRIAQAGFDMESSMKLSKSGLMLASVAGEDFKQVIDGLIGMVYAFNISMKQLPNVANAITVAAVKSKMTVQEFFTGLSYVSAPAVAAFGNTTDTINDMTAALMTLNNVGLDASRAGTYLRGSILKLAAPAERATLAFAQYGINIYDAQGASSNYYETLIKGQKSLSSYTEKLNSLKQQQFDIVNSGGAASASFQKVTKEIGETESSIGVLEKGLDTVYEQFVSAGGKMKPFNEIIANMASSMPVEVVGKLFGIRGGQALQALIVNQEAFNKNRALVSEAMKVQDETQGALGKIFGKILDTIYYKWVMIGNRITSTLSVIFDELFEAAKPILDTVLSSFEQIFNFVNSNRGIFKDLFSGLATAVSPLIENFFKQVPQVISQLSNVNKPMNVPMYSYSFEKGKEGIYSVNQEVKSTDFFTRLGAIIQSLASLFVATLQPLFLTLKPVLNVLGTMVAEGVKTWLAVNLPFFVSIGTAIASGVISGLVGLPGKIAAGWGNEIGQTLLGTPAQGLANPFPLPNAVSGVFGTALTMAGTSILGRQTEGVAQTLDLSNYVQASGSLAYAATTGSSTSKQLSQQAAAAKEAAAAASREAWRKGAVWAH